MHTPFTLQFRDFDDGDLPIVVSGIGDPQVTRYYGLETIHTNALAIAREQLSWYRELTAEGEGWWQAICLNGLPIGAIGAYDRDEDGDSAELGYWLLPSHWGCGIMLSSSAMATQRISATQVAQSSSLCRAGELSISQADDGLQLCL